ncbi:hypothetical protein BaRGS_00018386 [Batillaria attramentaria]|uniref:Uncharacterized protein n=1 Tax=Batillaria attramentaria TaxID=370345 RepID=A0ABD0KUE0_9CAEN
MLPCRCESPEYAPSVSDPSSFNKVFIALLPNALPLPLRLHPVNVRNFATAECQHFRCVKAIQPFRLNEVLAGTEGCLLLLAARVLRAVCVPICSRRSGQHCEDPDCSPPRLNRFSLNLDPRPGACRESKLYRGLKRRKVLGGGHFHSRLVKYCRDRLLVIDVGLEREMKWQRSKQRYVRARHAKQKNKKVKVRVHFSAGLETDLSR